MVREIIRLNIRESGERDLQLRPTSLDGGRQLLLYGSCMNLVVMVVEYADHHHAVYFAKSRELTAPASTLQ